MATDRYHVCRKCGEKSWAGSLFDSLRGVALGKVPCCSQCGAQMALHLSLNRGRCKSCRLVLSYAPCLAKLGWTRPERSTT